MDAEEKELLNKSVELAEENNKILHSIWRSMRISRIMTYAYWVFIVGSAVGAFYLIQPYFEGITGGVKDNFNSINEAFQNFNN